MATKLHSPIPSAAGPPAMRSVAAGDHHRFPIAQAALDHNPPHPSEPPAPPPRGRRLARGIAPCLTRCPS